MRGVLLVSTLLSLACADTTPFYLAPGEGNGAPTAAVVRRSSCVALARRDGHAACADHFAGDQRPLHIRVQHGGGRCERGRRRRRPASGAGLGAALGPLSALQGGVLDLRGVRRRGGAPDARGRELCARCVGRLRRGAGPRSHAWASRQAQCPDSTGSPSITRMARPATQRRVGQAAKPPVRGGRAASIARTAHGSAVTLPSLCAQCPSSAAPEPRL